MKWELGRATLKLLNTLNKEVRGLKPVLLGDS